MVLGGSPGAPAANPEDGDRLRADPVHDQLLPLLRQAWARGGRDQRREVQREGQVRAAGWWPRARVGSSPLAAAVDERTDTVYVVNGNNGTVSVLNGARCNARVTRGCGRPVATVKVGKFPVAAVVNPATRTLYVANLGARQCLGDQRGQLQRPDDTGVPAARPGQ